MSTPVRVVLAADEGFARPLAVTARSVVANFVDDRDLELFVIDMGIAPETRAQHCRIASRARGPPINWVDGRRGPPAGLPTVGWFTTAVYARLLIPDLLPDVVERVIYLDSDVVVRKSIDSLFDSRARRSPRPRRARPRGSVRLEPVGARSLVRRRSELRPTRTSTPASC